MSLIQRHQYIEYLDSLLTELRQGHRISKPIINYVGLKGIGKTSLLQQVFHHYCGQYSIASVYLAAAPRQHNIDNPPEMELLLSFFRSLPGLKSVREPELSFTKPTFSQRFEIVELSRAIQDNFPLIVIIEPFDNFSYWNWLQQEVIKPLIETGNTLVLCASHAPLGLMWDLNEQCKHQEVTAFSLDETRAFLTAYQLAPLTELLHTFTLGYPLALSQVVQFFSRTPHAGGDADILTSKPYTYSETLAMLRIVGILRRVNIPVVTALLRRFAPSWSASPYWEAFLRNDIFPELKRLDILYFSEPMRFALEARQAVELYLQQHRPLLRLKIYIFLTHVYEQRIRRYPFTSSVLLNEWLFFSAPLLAHSNKVQRHQDWLRTVDELISLITPRPENKTPHSFEQSTDGLRSTNPGLSDSFSSNSAVEFTVAFYKDSELQAVLEAVGLRQAVVERIQSATHDLLTNMPHKVLSESEQAEYRRLLLSSLSGDIPTENLDELLHAITGHNDTFELPALCDDINAEKEPSEMYELREIEDEIKFLEASGAVISHGARLYSLHPLIKPFAI